MGLWLALAALLLPGGIAACSGDDGEDPLPSATISEASPTTPAATAERPTATATPRPATAPPPTTAPSGPSRVIEHGSRSSKLVALTLDMGGRVDPAIDIMNLLIQRKVKATIFMTGAMVDNKNTDAGRRVLKMVEENPQLFALGSHSYSHPDFRELSAEAIASELSRTEKSIAEHVKVSPRPLFRPPFGGYNQAALAAIGKAGYTVTVMWDIDTIDWRPESEGGPTAEAIVRKVLDKAQGGSIVLMHLGGYNTLQALQRIIDGLAARGYQFATVAELSSQ